MPVESFSTLENIAKEFRSKDDIKLRLLFAFNGIGKTRLSMEFKEKGKQRDSEGNVISRDTLYFNAYTEDLFTWDNDLENDSERVLKYNASSEFFRSILNGDLEIENKIRTHLHGFVDFDFRIDYNENHISFFKREFLDYPDQSVTNIKISRGEESLFIWCFFLAIAQLALEENEAYKWVKHIYIDDPVSSLDENYIIQIACNLAQLIKGEEEGNTISHPINFIISTHHSLFYNVFYNEFRRYKKTQKIFMFKNSEELFSLTNSEDTPFFHHIATLSQLKKAADSGEVYTYHFNALRSILEKTAAFFGYDKIDKCIEGLDNEVLFERALNLFSHGKYSVFSPALMIDDNKELFKKILNGFINKYKFELPPVFIEGETI